MPLCSVSTDEATKATASTNTGTANHAGASDNKAKKGMGGEPGFLPMAMHSMPKAPMANITGTVSAPPSKAPWRNSVSLRADHTRCQ